ncbi:MAG: ABC transporter substrate-binding protein, partial [Propionibacteriaceae bacterium]|nr:ABC transporter substrate-binding protein [Propionibacteriaceae bacterium]
MVQTRRTARKTIRTALLILVGTCFVGLGACSGPGPADSNPTGAQPKTIAIGATIEPVTLDFTASDDAAIGQVLLYNVYETLVKIDASGRIRPLLALQYEQSKDRLEYTFDLDPKAKFASGSPVDAAAVVASIERVKDAASATLKEHMAVVKEAVAVDAHTVKVTLTRPSNRWIYDMASTAGIIVDPAAGDLAATALGSGPFQVGDWLAGDHIA